MPWMMMQTRRAGVRDHSTRKLTINTIDRSQFSTSWHEIINHSVRRPDVCADQSGNKSSRARLCSCPFRRSFRGNSVLRHCIKQSGKLVKLCSFSQNLHFSTELSRNAGRVHDDFDCTNDSCQCHEQRRKHNKYVVTNLVKFVY